MNDINDEIAKEASRWIARLNSGVFSSDDEKRLRNWLDASEANRREYHAQIELWQEFGTFESDLRASNIDDCLEMDAADAGLRKSSKLVDLPIGKAWRRLSVAASGLVAASLFAGFLIFSGEGPPVSGPQRYLTQKGHQTEALLADNTRILMNTDSNLVVEYQKAVRHVALEKGEAFFDVASDPDRPFIVETQWGDVRVLGTQFNVLSTSEGLRVDVLEGLVEIIPSEELAGAGTDVYLSANQSLKVTGQRVANSQLETGTVADVAPWRDGVLTFSHQRLEEVVAEVNRYSNREIIIAAAELKSLPVSGSFNIGDVSAFLEGLEAILPLRAIRRNGNILLERAV